MSAATLLTYPPVRFVLEGWFRGDTPYVFAGVPLTISQYVSLAGVAAGVVWLAVLLRARAKEKARV